MRALFERFWASPPPAAQDPSQTFFYEVIPSAQINVPRDDIHAYTAREALTRDVLATLVPDILHIAHVDPGAQSQLGPGGYHGETNPSLQLHAAISDAHAQVVAAALGFVFRQESVLVADLRDGVQGKTAYAIVDLGPRALRSADAHAFYLHAATTDVGLAEGYTAFHDDMLFFNLRDGAGVPYGKLADDVFMAALRSATEGFESAAAILATGVADARLVENDWSKAHDDTDYAMMLDGEDLDALRSLRGRHTTMVRAWLARIGSAAH